MKKKKVNNTFNVIYESALIFSKKNRQQNDPRALNHASIVRVN